MKAPTGIVWAGNVGDLGGYGNVSRNYLRVFKKIEIPVSLANTGQTHHEIGEEDLALLHEINSPPAVLGSTPFLFVNSIPELFPLFASFPFTKQIGVTLFETDRIPHHWVPLCNEMDEIWVPSHFNFRTFSQSGVNPQKIKVVPYPIQIENYKGPFEPFPFPEEVRSFVFLYTLGFDYRKGLDLLIESYCEEFTDQEDVSLVLKIYQWNNYYEIEQIIHSYIPSKKNNPHIYVILQTFHRKQLLSLYSSSTCFVSLDRGNGWGMPQMEMMAMGKPVITINWGGGTEFMTEENAFLIEPEKELEGVHPILQSTRSQYYLGHRWPVIKMENVRKTLRDAFSNKDKREQLAKKAKEKIQKNYTIDVVAEKIKNLLFRDSL